MDNKKRNISHKEDKEGEIHFMQIEKKWMCLTLELKNKIKLLQFIKSYKIKSFTKFKRKEEKIKARETQK